MYKNQILNQTVVSVFAFTFSKLASSFNYKILNVNAISSFKIKNLSVKLTLSEEC